MSAGEDLARAFTLPASAYIDESVYRRERDRIFARTWQLVARADGLSRVGDLKPATILDEPILITRGL
ncbi:MAG: aromatic ring-hydroxylating dioxygenase subunit alpha, partial [Chloroflexi bacterium]